MKCKVKTKIVNKIKHIKIRGQHNKMKSKRVKIQIKKQYKKLNYKAKKSKNREKKRLKMIKKVIMERMKEYQLMIRHKILQMEDKNKKVKIIKNKPYDMNDLINKYLNVIIK